MTKTVVFDRVSIVFGDRPKAALPLMDAGHTRDEIKQKTGQTLGVHDCTLEVEKGEILVLMGLSGSGKSTLLRAVNALNPVVRGAVLIDGGGRMVNITQADARLLRKMRLNRIAMVFQQFALLPWRNVRDNVGLGLELSKMPRAEREERVNAQLELVGLSACAGHKVAELSGGMQQRVGLARAFVTQAPILLMDEPFSALDPLIRAHLQDELLELQKKFRATIIFVSHDLDEAFRLGNRIAIMEGGRIVQCARPQEIIQNPASAYVADFVANMNPLRALRAGDIMAPGGQTQGAPRVAHDATMPELIKLLLKEDKPLQIFKGEEHIGSITRQNLLGALIAQNEAGPSS